MFAKPRLIFALLLLVICTGSVRADLSRSQARKAITRMAGFNLPSKAVNISSINSTAADSAEASADLQLVFRLVQNEDGIWRVAEMRTGQDLWEDVGVLARAANFTLPAAQCHVANVTGRRDSDLSAKRVRCLVANLFGINLPSDEVRVKEFSSLEVPLGTETSAVAVVFVRADFRFRKDAKSWQVTEFKSGNREWINVAGLSGALQTAKRTQAEQDMRAIAFALEEYKKQRGHYIATDKHPVIIDHLHPRFLNKVLRLDPWRRPYLYQGEGQGYTLRSSGPDGKRDTPDDITLSESSK
jgi:hypothetical protein